MILLGKGRNETAISSSRLICMTGLFTYCRRTNRPCCASQMPPMVTKLVA
jgi:hypothetical protein